MMSHGVLHVDNVVHKRSQAADTAIGVLENTGIVSWPSGPLASQNDVYNSGLL